MSLIGLKHRSGVEKEETHGRKMHLDQATINLILQVQQFDHAPHLEGGAGD